MGTEQNTGRGGEDAVSGWALVEALIPHSGQTWEEFEQDVRSRLCLCCAVPGHYQEKVEAHMAEHGVDGLAIYCVDQELRDGHHRVLAARRLGIEALPTESEDANGARWLRDHGPVDWTRRRVGDMTRGEASWVVTDGLMAAFGTRQFGRQLQENEQ